MLNASLCTAEDDWITILVHGAIGFQANLSVSTAIQARKDCIKGTAYEKNVLAVREHPYFFALQPINQQGLHKVKPDPSCTNASYAFSVLFDDMLRLYGRPEKNTYYTFGWSGLISGRRRYDEARCLYNELKEVLATLKKEGRLPKVRFISYSHGANLTLNLADLRDTEFCKDSFLIDELIVIGLPIQAVTTRQVQSPLFKDVYSIYSRGDKIQRVDATSPSPYNIFSQRIFKGRFRKKITQIELRFTAPFRKNPCYCLPPNMRGTVNQSPGHTELWFFGWTESGYRKNLHMYPLPGAVFIPYLMAVAKKEKAMNFQVDIRPEKEIAIVRSDCDTTQVPFMSLAQYNELITKAYTFDPSKPEYRDTFVKLQTSVDIKAYR